MPGRFRAGTVPCSDGDLWRPRRSRHPRWNATRYGQRRRGSAMSTVVRKPGALPAMGRVGARGADRRGGNTPAIPRVGKTKGVGLPTSTSPPSASAAARRRAPLRGRQAVKTAGRSAHDNRNVVVAVETCDFLDQVSRQREVGTPRGSRHRERAVAPSTTQPTAADRRMRVGPRPSGAHFTDGEMIVTASPRRSTSVTPFFTTVPPPWLEEKLSTAPGGHRRCCGSVPCSKPA